MSTLKNIRLGQFVVSRGWKIPLFTLEPFPKSLLRDIGENKTIGLTVLFVSDQGLTIIPQRRRGEVSWLSYLLLGSLTMKTSPNRSNGS